MDKVYQADIPKYRRTLLDLKREFARVRPVTDWTALRIDPLLAYVASLERLLRSAKFARERARLRKGVGLFHSDLIYLRANIEVLKNILAGEARCSDTERTNDRRDRSPRRSGRSRR